MPKQELLTNEVEKFGIRDLEFKLHVYERVLHYLHMQAQVTMNYDRLGEILGMISDWSRAHRDHNGELTITEIEENIQKAFIRIAQRVGAEFK